jgi:mono/diheme cytochrome c family protein
LDRRVTLAFVVTAALAVAGCGGGGSGGDSHPATVQPSALAERGAGLVQVKPCLVCHTTDGSKGAGPTFAGLAGSTVKLANGTTVTAGDAYLKESILDPDAKTVAGFPKGLMVTLVPPHSLTPLQADAIVAYLDTLSPRPSSK